MSKSVFQCWVGLCEESGTFLCPLQVSDSRPETGIYMCINQHIQTKKKFVQNWSYYYDDTAYYVWVDGKCISATDNYLYAIEQFMNVTGSLT